MNYIESTVREELSISVNLATILKCFQYLYSDDNFVGELTERILIRR